MKLRYLSIIYSVNAGTVLSRLSCACHVPGASYVGGLRQGGGVEEDSVSSIETVSRRIRCVIADLLQRCHGVESGAYGLLKMLNLVVCMCTLE